MAVIHTHLSKLPKKDPEGVEGPNLMANGGFDQVTLCAMELACSCLTTPMGQYRVHTRKFTAIRATVESDWVSPGEFY